MAQTYAVTVVQDGGNKYALDGVTTPTLNLLRGFVYIFDQSDSSNNGHPLRFKDADGSSYSTGVVVSGTPGNAGATVTLTVSDDTVGWSREGWNTGAWNTGIVIPSATGAVGATSTSGEGDIAVSGVAGTGSVGAATASATSTIALTGLAATGGVGAALVRLPNVSLSVTGLAATAAVGSTSTVGPANVSVTGVSGTGEIGSLQQPWGQIIPSQTPFWNTIAA